MSLTKVSYSMINGTYVNVLDFGAVGDGVADDTQAVIDALAYCSANGKSLFVPCVCKLTSTITLPRYVNIDGESSENSGFIYAGTGFAFTRSSPTVGDVRQIRTKYSNFFVRGVNTTQEGAFFFERVNIWEMDNLLIHNFKNSTNGTAVKMAECYWWHIHNSHFYDIGEVTIWMLGNESGYNTGCNAGLFGPKNKISCNNMAGATAIRCNGQEIQIFSSDISGVYNADTAIDLVNCEGIWIHGNYMEQWLEPVVKSNTDGYPARRVTISQNMINSTNVRGLDFDMTGLTGVNSHITVVENRFAEMQGTQTAIYFGNTEPWNLSGNDPNFARLSDKVFIEATVWEAKWVPGIQGAFTYDPPSIPANSFDMVELPVGQSGITTNDMVVATFSSLGTTDIQLTAWVRTYEVLRFLFHNISGAPIDLPSGTINFTVFKSRL